MTPYGDRDLGQHWLRYWILAWQHQAITRTNVDWSSVKSSDIHIRAISQEMHRPPITKICFKIICLKFHSNFPGDNELNTSRRNILVIICNSHFMMESMCILSYKNECIFLDIFAYDTLPADICHFVLRTCPVQCLCYVLINHISHNTGIFVLFI